MSTLFVSKGESNCCVLTEEESMYQILLKKDSQLCKCLCSEKLKSVKFRVLVL